MKVLEKDLTEALIALPGPAAGLPAVQSNKLPEVAKKSGLGKKIAVCTGAAAATVAAGAAIKNHLDKKKVQNNSQDTQQEAAEFGFYDATAVDEGV